MPYSQQASELLKDAVAVLMDQDLAQCTQDDKSVWYEFSHTKEEEKYNTDDLSVKSDHSYCSEDSSKSNYLETDDDLMMNSFTTQNDFYTNVGLLYQIKKYTIKIGLSLKSMLKCFCHLGTYQVPSLPQEPNLSTEQFLTLYIKMSNLVQYVLQITQSRKET